MDGEVFFLHEQQTFNQVLQERGESEDLLIKVI